MKMGIDCITDEQLLMLTEVSRLRQRDGQPVAVPVCPYVGANAFSHKAGYHVDGVNKWKDGYQHIDPARVGNLLAHRVSELPVNEILS